MMYRTHLGQQTVLLKLKDLQCVAIKTSITSESELGDLSQLTKLGERFGDLTLFVQWLVSKIIPIHKKGEKNKIENYRPISNLCCVSKVFEKLILMRVKKIQIIYDGDLTGKPQHGFKEARSTLMA